MESSVLLSLIVGGASLIVAAHATICLAGVDGTCILNRSGTIVTAIIGYATVVPLVFCLHAAWADHRVQKVDERLPLLGISNDKEATVKPSRVQTYLYVSHFLSAWGDNMWQFAIPILFMEVFVDTLLPSATFSLIMYTACIVAIPSVGRLLDRTNRWTAMKYSILLENAMIVVSSMVLGLIMLVTNADGIHKPEWTPELLCLFSATLMCGGVGQVLNDAQTLAVERDWVVVLAGRDSATLAELNTIMRRIDLSCTILAPVAFGIIMDFAGENPTTRAMVGAATVGLWNLVSTPLEYVMTKDIYDLTPELAAKEQHNTDDRLQQDGGEPSHPEKGVVAAVRRYSRSWRNYSNHPVFLISLAFCGLYMTILNSSALNTVYLKWRGVPDSVLGVSRGAGAVSGLVGTFVFPVISRWLGSIERAAVMSVWLFWLSLAPVVVVFVIRGESEISDYTMIACTTISRAWLWSADLAETQIMQEWVEPNRRGAINSMQTATYQFAAVVMQFMGIVFHDPRQFETLVFFSLTAVLASAIGFSIWDVKYGRHRSAYVCGTDNDGAGIES